jgi:hypothetical protein
MALIRFLFRLTATLLLAVAVIMAVVDATRSIASETVVLTPLSESWHALSPDTLQSARAASGESAVPFASAIFETLLASPGAAVVAILALVLFLIGRRPARRVGRFVVEG